MTAVTVVVLVAGGATAYAVSSSGNSGYRMATVVRASIANSEDLVGTVEPVNDTSASFQVSGQVATIDATVGQQVTAGQVLGTLDTTSLSESVSSAQSSLASDEAQLTEDEDSQASSTTTTTTTTTPSTTGGGSASTGGSGGKPGGSGAGTSQISQDQATLVADQAKASAGQQQEAADLTQALKICVASSSTSTSTAPSSATSNPGFTPPSTTTTTTTTTTTPTTTPTTGANACGTAIDLVSSDQQAVAADQATVATDEGALAKLLTAEESSPGSGGSVGSVGSTGSVGSSTTTTTPSKASTGVSNFSGKGSGGSAVSGGSGASSPSDSAATIASDEATIDTAEANLVNAQQSLSDAQLTAPITGTVASVGMSVGDTVSADSSTETIVIIGTQSFEAEATLSSTQVSSVKVGDPADVSVDGTNKPIAGSVSQVGPVQSSDGTYTYPVVVALPPSATGLFAGSSANISITTSQVENVLAVPTSAVNTEGTRSFVVELSAGNPVDKTVKVGVVGYTYTQLISGLKEGDRVVLANYSEAVPTSSATTLGGFGGGGFGGAGRFGAGGAGLGGGGRFTVGGGGATFGG